jgi:hypothetical protein
MSKRIGSSTTGKGRSVHRSALLCAAVLWGVAPAARAGFVGPGAGRGAGIDFSVANVNAAAGPLFGANGELVNIGAIGPAAAGYGSLGAPITPIASAGGGIAGHVGPIGGAGQSLFVAPNPALGFGGNTGGQANLFATTTNGGGGAGVFWTAPTFIADSGPDGRASVGDSRGVATFFDANGDAGKVPGVALAIHGTLGGQGPAGAFVAASLLGTFTITPLVGAPTVVSTSVVIVSDGTGPRNDFVIATSFAGFTGAGADSFSAYGVSLLPPVDIPAGATVTLDGTLSFVADPPASFTFDIVPLTVPLPDLGVFGPESPQSPEPSAALLLGIGVVAAGVLRRRFAAA